MPRNRTTSFLLDDVPPMGIYETLYAFADAFGQFMGTEGTHPWSQGFPLTTPLEMFDGPELPASVDVTWEDRFYPKAWGHPLLRETIVDYYNTYYGSSLEPDNVMIFAGGRPGIWTVLSFLKKDIQVRIGNVEWPAYLDILTQTHTDWKTVRMTPENGFHPTNAEYFDRSGLNHKTKLFPVISNPSNPTGHARAGDELEELIGMAEESQNGILLDEAYEMYHSPSVSGIQYVKDLEGSNVFLSGACTKGLQCPGIRIGWIIASKANIEVLSNFSSFGMGGVSHPSQLYAVELFKPERVAKQRKAIEAHYNFQRQRYGEAFEKMGHTLDTEGVSICKWDESGTTLLYRRADETKIWSEDSARTLARGHTLGAIDRGASRAVLAGASRGHLTLHDLESGDVLDDVTLDDAPNDLAFSPDGGLIAVAGYDRNVHVLDGHTLDVVARLLGHQKAVGRVTWNDDGSRLISTSEDGTARVWSVERGSMATYLTGAENTEAPLTGPVPSIAVTPDGKNIVVAGERLRLFPLNDPTVLRCHGTYVYYVTFSPDGSMLASSAFQDPAIRVWSVEDAALLRTIDLEGGSYYAFGHAPFVAFTSEGEHLVASSNSRTIKQDLETGAMLPVSSHPNPFGRVIETLGRHPWGGPAEAGRALSPDGRTYARCRGVVEIYRSFERAKSTGGFLADTVEIDKAEIAARLRGHTDLAYCVAFSPDGNRIATGGNDNTVRIWDAHTFEQLLVLRGHDQYVQCVAFSSDGSVLASASGDTTIRLWDTQPLHERRATGTKR